jgi:hypothetical protein
MLDDWLSVFRRADQARADFAADRKRSSNHHGSARAIVDPNAYLSRTLLLTTASTWALLGALAMMIVR